MAKSPTCMQVTGQFPEKSSMISYRRRDRRFEGLYGRIVTGLGLDFSKLPPALAIRPYLQTSSSFYRAGRKGIPHDRDWLLAQQSVARAAARE